LLLLLALTIRTHYTLAIDFYQIQQVIFALDMYFFSSLSFPFSRIYLSVLPIIDREKES
jgi:hypothetical protein